MGKIIDHALPLGCQIGGFTIESYLGAGGFGVTYGARDKNLDRRVAIKEFFPSVLSAVRQTDGSVAMTPGEGREAFFKLRKGFLEEAQRLARFNHPNITRVVSFFEANNTAYFVMDLEEGDSLEARFRRGDAFSEAELMGIVLPLLQALRLIHGEGMIHRDLKPGNILIRKDGSPVLLDFGAARDRLEDERTLTNLLTPGYAPMEQYFGKSSRQGPWTDLYSLGAILFRAVFGVPPPDAIGRGGALARKLPDPISATFAKGSGDYSRDFLRAIEQSLQVDERLRPQSVDQWLTLFQTRSPTRAAPAARTTDDVGDTLALIEKLPFFQHFSDYERRRIAVGQAVVERFAAGQVIIREGDSDDRFFIMVSGSVAVFKEGLPEPLATLGPGAIFGEVSFLTEHTRTASVIAQNPVLVVELHKQQLTRLGAEIREKIKDVVIEQMLWRMKDMSRQLAAAKAQGGAPGPADPGEEDEGTAFFQEDEEGGTVMMER